jgi:hypothetical protein
MTVTGETRVLTSRGYRRVDSIVNKPVAVWNPEMNEYVRATVRTSGLYSHPLCLAFTNNVTLCVSDDQRFMIEACRLRLASLGERDSVVVSARYLQIGDYIKPVSIPPIKPGSGRMYESGKFHAESDLPERTVYFNTDRLAHYKEVAQRLQDTGYTARIVIVRPDFYRLETVDSHDTYSCVTGITSMTGRYDLYLVEFDDGSHNSVSRMAIFNGIPSFVC